MLLTKSNRTALLVMAEGRSTWIALMVRNRVKLQAKVSVLVMEMFAGTSLLSYEHPWNHHVLPTLWRTFAYWHLGGAWDLPRPSFHRICSRCHHPNHKTRSGGTFEKRSRIGNQVWRQFIADHAQTCKRQLKQACYQSSYREVFAEFVHALVVDIL